MIDKYEKTNKKAINRLIKCYGYLSNILDDVDFISSKSLGNHTGISPAVVRKDFNIFGSFGDVGRGYNVKLLYRQIKNILGLSREYTSVIIGVGNIGVAICKYYHSYNLNMRVKGIFDVNTRIQGFKICDMEIMETLNLEGFLANNSIDIGLICTPEKNAQYICDILVKGGVKAIWNFSPIDLKASDNIVIKNTDLTESLLTLTSRMNIFN